MDSSIRTIPSWSSSPPTSSLPATSCVHQTSAEWCAVLVNGGVLRVDCHTSRRSLPCDDSLQYPRRSTSSTTTGPEREQDVFDREVSWRIHNCWPFDTDDEPSVGHNGPDEKAREFMDEYHPKYLLKGMSLYQEDDHQRLTTDLTIYTPSSDGRPLGISPYQTGIASAFCCDAIIVGSRPPDPFPGSSNTRVQHRHKGAVNGVATFSHIISLFRTNAESQGKNGVLKHLSSCFPLLTRVGFVHTYDATAALAFGQCFICIGGAFHFCHSQDFGALSVHTSYNDMRTPNDGNAHSSEQYSSTKVKDTAIKKRPSTVAEGKKPDAHRGKTKQGWNIHPAGVPKIRHSKAKTKADCEAKMKALDKKLHEICMSKKRLAQMDRRLIDMETDSEECFDLREAGNSSELDSEPESHKAAKTETQAADTKTKRSRKKRVKGAAHQELKMRTEELHNTKRSFVLGGLCDDDLEDARPAVVEQSPRHITSHRNEMVTIGKKTDVCMGKPLAKSRVLKPKAVKTTAKKKVLCVEEVPVDVKPSTECLDNPHWTRTFLPTLSHALYISDHPFTDWTWQSSTFLETMQAVFDMSFTNISYTISPQDCILKAAYDRMKTRRSKIVGDVLASVKRFFEGPEFHTRPKKIKDYIPWALGSGGPAYYDTPVPANCRLRLGDPDCPQPDGFLHSQFILPIAKQYLTFAAKSVYHPTLGPKNPPKGLYAIILTAVECAMRAHIMGVFIAPGDFTHQNTWGPMADFYTMMKRASESHWKQALNFSGSDDIAERCANESLLQSKMS
ncbi:hypothetical protein EI94DRAFT_1886678 [Lactarius quietus]|nr:hypothetical protein EI94DRAFT_1886678 [Lactarius quietus]